LKSFFLPKISFISRLFKDGELKRSRTILRLEPLEGEQAASYSLRLATSHYAFSLKRSVTNRSIQNFYELAAILKVGFSKSLNVAFCCYRIRIRSLPITELTA
jgi:hypothetical protein